MSKTNISAVSTKGAPLDQLPIAVADAWPHIVELAQGLRDVLLDMGESLDGPSSNAVKFIRVGADQLAEHVKTVDEYLQGRAEE